MRVTDALVRRVTVGANWSRVPPEYGVRCELPGSGHDKKVIVSLQEQSPFTEEGFRLALASWQDTQNLEWAMVVARIINQSPALAIQGEVRSKVFKSLVSEHDALESLPDELLAVLLLEGFVQ